MFAFVCVFYIIKCNNKAHSAKERNLVAMKKGVRQIVVPLDRRMHALLAWLLSAYVSIGLQE